MRLRVRERHLRERNSRVLHQDFTREFQTEVGPAVLARVVVEDEVFEPRGLGGRHSLRVCDPVVEVHESLVRVDHGRPVDAGEVGASAVICVLQQRVLLPVHIRHRSALALVNQDRLWTRTETIRLPSPLPDNDF